MDYIDKLKDTLERCVLAVYEFCKMRSDNDPPENEDDKYCKEEDVPPVDVDSQKSAINEREVIVSQFLQIQDKVLYGTYGSLYKASELMRRAESLLTDMNERISYIDGNEELKAYWGNLKNNPSALLDFIVSAGVTRGNSEYIIADNDTRNYYSTVGDDKIIPGEKYSVVDPCWTNGDIVLEKGLIELTDKDE